MATIGDIVTINATEAAEAEARRHRNGELRAERNRRFREKKAEERRLAAIAEIEQAERDVARWESEDETLAPYVLRRAIFGRDGQMIRGALVTVMDARPMFSDPVSGSRRFTERQKQAAKRLQTDWREVGEGTNAGAVDLLATRGGGDGEGRHSAMVAQINVRTSLEAAWTHLGAFAPGVKRVVIDCIPLSAWSVETQATKSPKTPDEAGTWIGLALDRLANFYHPPRTELPVRSFAIGPGRGAYHVAGEYSGEDFDERGRLITP